VLSQISLSRKMMGVRTEQTRSDDQLLDAASKGDGAAFGIFYERHLAAVVAYVRGRTASAEAAADLTAEVFAAALLACSRYRPGEAPALAWLLGIARNKLRETARRERVSANARRQLGLWEIPFAEDDSAQLEALAREGSMVLSHLDQLPEDQRVAVWRRIIEEKNYEGLAHEFGCSQELVRQRVSRGLRSLPARLQDDT
jgi:RNA polymerase sigma-70 factor (ECF subfamily)